MKVKASRYYLLAFLLQKVVHLLNNINFISKREEIVMKNVKVIKKAANFFNGVCSWHSCSLSAAAAVTYKTGNRTVR